MPLEASGSKKMWILCGGRLSQFICAQTIPLLESLSHQANFIAHWKNDLPPSTLPFPSTSSCCQIIIVSQCLRGYTAFVSVTQRIVWDWLQHQQDTSSIISTILRQVLYDQRCIRKTNVLSPKIIKGFRAEGTMKKVWALCNNTSYIPIQRLVHQWAGAQTIWFVKK